MIFKVGRTFGKTCYGSAGFRFRRYITIVDEKDGVYLVAKHTDAYSPYPGAGEQQYLPEHLSADALSEKLKCFKKCGHPAPFETISRRTKNAVEMNAFRCEWYSRKALKGYLE